MLDEAFSAFMLRPGHWHDCRGKWVDDFKPLAAGRSGRGCHVPAFQIHHLKLPCKNLQATVLNFGFAFTSGGAAGGTAGEGLSKTDLEQYNSKLVCGR